MRVPLYEGTVHERPGVALIRVADQIPVFAFHLPASKPFAPCGESCPSPPAQALVLYLFKDILPGHGKTFLQCRVTVPGKIVVHILRINNAAVPQYYPHLGCEHGMIKKSRDTFDRPVS